MKPRVNMRLCFYTVLNLTNKWKKRGKWSCGEDPRALNNIQLSNLHGFGVSEARGREKCRKTCGQIVAEHFPKLMKDIKVKIQETHRIPTRFKQQHTCLPPSVKSLNTANGKNITYEKCTRYSWLQLSQAGENIGVSWKCSKKIVKTDSYVP